MEDANRVLARRVRHGWRYRTNVGLRTLAGTLGAYLLASLAATALSQLLPMSPTDAVLMATMAAFLIAPAVTIWAFLARRPRDAMGGVLLAAGVIAGLIWLTGRGG
jgi:hypothetical protein